MKKTLPLLMIITFISQFFGLIKDMVLSYYYGASAVTDVFLLSITILLVLFSLIGAGISTSFVPFFRKIETNYGIYEANKFSGTLYNSLNIFVTIIVILGLIFTDQIVNIFALGFNDSMFREAVIFTRISLFGGYFTVTILLLNAFLRLHNQFLIPAVNTIIPHIFLIIFIYLSTVYSIYYLIYGVVIGLFFQYVVLLIFAFKKGFRFTNKLKYKDNNKNNHTKNLLFNSLPVMFSDLLSQISVVVDKSLASYIAVGGISSLSYAGKINGFVQGIFVLSIANIMYPKISEMVANKKIKELKIEISRVIGLIIFFVIPATIGSIVLSQPIVQLLFGRGAFNFDNVIMTANILVFYSVGMIGYSLREILLRIFYSLQDTKTPMINTVVTVVINIVLSITLSRFLGIAGLAIATSIAGILSMVFLFYKLIKKIGTINFSEIIVSFGKIVISSIIMGFVVFYIYSLLIINNGNSFSLIISVIIGVILYIFLVMIFKVKEIKILSNKLIYRK